MFQVSSSVAWIPDRRLYKGLRIRLVSLRVCSGPQQAQLFSSWTAARKNLSPGSRSANGQGIKDPLLVPSQVLEAFLVLEICHAPYPP